MKGLKLGLILMLGLSGMVACNKNDGGSSPRAAVGTTGTMTQSTGTISGTYNVTQETQNFLSTNTFDANQISQVNQTSGLSFMGVARFDQSNNLIPQSSYINVRVNFTDANNMQQSVVVGIPGYQGYVTYSGYSSASAQIKFEDQYGSVTMEGYFDRNSFTGTMYYYNKATNVQGQLGQFRVPTCGFFNCVQ